ncbi:MAG: glycosyltransferase family 2 protein [Rhodobacteraceae bacterium]|nr:MAG: glycosyltransferase family 2 protein [Paracoccaceae bacterium]
MAAWNAEATVGRAVASALAEPETAEVLLIDDASTDATVAAARQAATGDPRLRVIQQQRNVGPAAARNLGLRRSTAPFVALLDADDVFLGGRLAHLFSLPEWDLAADNIAFGASAAAPAEHPVVEHLDLAAFVRGNIPRDGVERGELGFLKPLMRRAFLEQHGLSYSPGLRLGEDYDLYVRCLMQGARFSLSHRVGYVAEVRGDSLSSRHATGDLAALLAATEGHLSGATDAGARDAMRRHRRHLRKRYLHRAFLDRKSGQGALAALAFALVPPTRVLPIASGILADKRGGATGRAPRVARTLLPISGGPGR